MPAHCASGWGWESTAAISSSSIGSRTIRWARTWKSCSPTIVAVLGLEGERVERAPHRALDRVLERDQRLVGIAPLDREDRVVDGRRPHRLEVGLRRRLAQRVFGERPGRPEVGDPHRAIRTGPCRWLRCFRRPARPGTGSASTSRVASPFGAGVSGIVTVAVSPTSMLLMSCCKVLPPLTVTETVTPFSVDSPWFWTWTSTSGVSSAATAVAPSGLSSVPLMLVEIRPSPWTPGVAAPVAPLTEPSAALTAPSSSHLVPSGRNSLFGTSSPSIPLSASTPLISGRVSGAVEDVARQQHPHLPGDRFGRLLRADVAQCGAHPVGDRGHRRAAQLVDQLQRVLGARHVARRVEPVDPGSVVVHRAAVGVDLGDELGDREVAGVRELAEEVLAGLLRLVDDLADVARVVAQCPVLAGVEAAAHAEHDQDQDQQPDPEGEGAPEQDLLALGTAWRARSAAAAGMRRNPPRSCSPKLVGWPESIHACRLGASRPAATRRFFAACQAQEEGGRAAKSKGLWSAPWSSTGS